MLGAMKTKTLAMYIAFAVTLFRVTTARSQENFEPPFVAPSFEAVEIFSDILLDGKLTELPWEQVKAVTDFFRMEPRQGGKYLYESSVKVLYDKKNLYFGIFCKDSVGQSGIRVQDYRRD